MPIKDHMAYIVLVAHRSGEYLPEQNVSSLDRATVVKDIADGQYEDLIQVIELNPVEGTCRDVTEDIAWEVSARWSLRPHCSSTHPCPRCRAQAHAFKL